MKIFSSRKTGKKVPRGQSLVELAISLMVILMLLAGAVDFGMAFYSYVALQDAAQEGALYGSFQPYVESNGTSGFQVGEAVNVAGVRNRIRASSRIPLDFNNTTLFPDTSITVETVPDSTKACEGITSGTANGIKVTIFYEYNLITPLLGGILGTQKIPLQASVTDTILEPRCP